jgi:hypothetical protein
MYNDQIAVGGSIENRPPVVLLSFPCSTDVTFVVDSIFLLADHNELKSWRELTLEKWRHHGIGIGIGEAEPHSYHGCR